SAHPKLSEIREKLATDLAMLPGSVKAIREPSRFPVEFSPKLKALREKIAGQTTNPPYSPFL
ncbi:MAG: hypothetical protein ACREP3_17490, partial [Candidatus Binatia bacterium]